MKKNTQLWKDWETKWLRESGVDFSQNHRIVESLYREARSLGVFPLRDPLDGLQAKINLAKALNVSGNP